MTTARPFRFSIDRGGTFTDIYAEVPGEPGYRVVKLLSEDPEQYPDAPLEGIRRILEEFSGVSLSKEQFDTSSVGWVRMGTTVATNALLERKGARTALLITRGFRDLLYIGKQNRPRLFDLKIRKPDPLYLEVVEVNERVRLVPATKPPPPKAVRGRTGDWVEIEKSPNINKLNEKLEELLEAGIDSLAVVFMHAYTFPDHEQRVGALAREMGFRNVVLSSETMPRIKIVDRGQTCCVDAYLTPQIQKYLRDFQQRFANPRAELLFMQSDGGLVPADRFRGHNAILSGPAGGVVGYARTAFDPETRRPVIGFDMGGTSTDVSRYDGNFEWSQETEISGVHLLAPQLDIRTVAAGGGSRLFFRNGMFEVGPESSGAHPGPVCYRKQGPLSLTDANLVVGRLLPEYFPKIFGPNHDQPLDRQASELAFRQLMEEVNAFQERQGLPAFTLEQVAQGFIEVANEVMARPIREISVARGHDLRDHVLACFGGAGGQHACALARALGIPTVKIHRFAGILSAYGLGMADVVVEKQAPASEVLNEDSRPGLQARLATMRQQVRADLKEQNFDDSRIFLMNYLNMGYDGTDTRLLVPEPADGDFARAFRELYRREYGFELTGRDLRVDDLKVRGIGRTERPKQSPLPAADGGVHPHSRARCYLNGQWRDTPVYLWPDLARGARIAGPAILINDTSTTVVDPECTAQVTPEGDVVIDVPQAQPEGLPTDYDPVKLAIFGNRFMSIAEQMGHTLQRTAVSTNIKERQDFSCAVFSPDGALVANAPHQPVHLGSMGEAVRAQIALHGDDMREGDVFLSNHPRAGGTHLPDLTVITPVMEQGRPIFFVASRGHHADIGGITPGSMPPFSTCLEEEGVAIRSFKLVDGGVFQEEALVKLFTTPPKDRREPGRPPLAGTRALADNLSDLKAQMAANQRGITLLKELVGLYSLPVVHAYMNHIQQSAEHAVRDVIRAQHGEKRGKHVLTAEDRMDDGTPIRLQITLHPEGDACFDFSGTGPQVAGNRNAPPAVTYSAVLYCLRCLVRSDIPLNQGCLNPVRFILREGSILCPSDHAAVAAGNVLTSQRVTDVVFRAFKVVAASQGCMNNLTFGNERFGYYETIGGGAGAGPGWHGQSGVHTHMTNTRITDPEILEQRYPVILREFSLRRGSGGAGRWRGGDGLVREIEFLQPLQVAILSERRKVPPYGLEGGLPGAVGRNLLVKYDGTCVELGGDHDLRVRPGERIRILTPGGGGYGPPDTDSGE